MNQSVTSTLRYARADNEALLNEKAYILNYSTPPEIARSNFVIDFFPGIKINNLRTAGLSFVENGLSIATLPDCISKEEFDDEEMIEKHYLPKREPSFPYQPKTDDNAPQPALSAHIAVKDYTEDEIKGRLHQYFKEKAENYGKQWFQIVNMSIKCLEAT
ncbi:hypothetical protein M7I_7782 [Glarea lozoyensis 74030]|uniref:Uncharacterized protein n=1 Tax=Glarea lozoyensis (strain ATCC 74030 / MF5533) TaxID=1104152 RepID=H0EY84_GLAL7|nr:hypothetical protein M7I_7782 [Glarea lozoyensis 74030]